MGRRWILLPSSGRLIVNTDLHGNLEDFEAMERRFRDHPGAHWLILGDVVHGPDEEGRRMNPALYDYEDRSGELVDRIAALRAAHPDRLHLVLGNHDHGHVGGPPVGKFHLDEVATLESRLAPDAIARLKALFREAALAAVAPCGLFFSHGSPSLLESLDELDRLPLEVKQADRRAQKVLYDLLTSYGQREEATTAFLERMSRSAGFPLSVVVHGHDRDESGWFADGTNQLQAVIFGAPKANKRYLEIDLAKHYRSAADLRDGIEIRRLHR